LNPSSRSFVLNTVAKNLYTVLDVHPDASSDEINFAYRRALESVAREGNDPGKREAVRQAYDTLSNPMLRSAYNASQGDKVYEDYIGADMVRSTEGIEGWLSIPWVRWVLAGLVVIVLLLVWKARKPPVKVVPFVPPAPTEEIAPLQSGVAAPPAVSPIVLSGNRSPEEIFAAVSGSVAKIMVQDAAGNTISSGSGVVIGSGIVITNCHVVQRASTVTVKLGPETYDGTLVQADEEFDLCRLSVTGLNARPVNIGSVANLRVGQKVLAIGSPYGLENTLSEGLVSALREVPGGTMIQTSAPISPGSSGGGLFDMTGTLVGINTFQHRYGQNLNFAVPADWINQMYSRSAGVGVGTIGNRPAPPEKELTASDLIVGQWWCYGSITGNTGTWTFSPTGTVMIEREGRLSRANYNVQDNTLRVFDAGGTLNWKLEEVTEKKMVIFAGDGRRLVCDKR
jgi:serine protease Do